MAVPVFCFSISANRLGGFRVLLELAQPDKMLIDLFHVLFIGVVFFAFRLIERGPSSAALLISSSMRATFAAAYFQTKQSAPLWFSSQSRS